MAGAWRISSALYLILGIGLLMLFGLGFGVGASSGMLELFVVACVPTALIPGIILTALGLRARRRDGELVEFAAWVKSYRRVTLAEVARKLGKTEFQTDKILVEVVDRGLVAGFIDRQTNEFVLKEEIGRHQYVEACTRCGASLKKMYPLGETVLCPYCGSVILAPPLPQAAPPYPAPGWPPQPPGYWQPPQQWPPPPKP